MGSFCDDTSQRLDDTCVKLGSKLTHVAAAVRTLQGDDGLKLECVEHMDEVARDIEALRRFMHNLIWQYGTMLEVVTEVTGTKHAGTKHCNE